MAVTINSRINDLEAEVIKSHVNDYQPVWLCDPRLNVSCNKATCQVTCFSYDAGVVCSRRFSADLPLR